MKRIEKRKKISSSKQTLLSLSSEEEEERKPLKKVRFHNLEDKSNDNRRVRKGFLLTERKIKEKQEKDFQKVIAEIRRRGGTFTKLGFTSEEKRTHKKLIGDVFHLAHKDLKGTMTITELWSSKERSHFLRENRIKMNKMKMMEKLTKINKKMQESGKKLKSIDSFRSIKEFRETKKYLDSLKQLSNIRHSSDKFEIDRMKKNKNNLNLIQNNLMLLQDKENTKDLRTKMKTLQDCTCKMQDMQKKYFMNLIQML